MLDENSVAVPARGTVVGKARKSFDSLILLIIWMVWCERNNRVFDKIAKPTDVFVELIKQEAKQWKIASAGRFALEQD